MKIDLQGFVNWYEMEAYQSGPSDRLRRPDEPSRTNANTLLHILVKGDATPDEKLAFLKAEIARAKGEEPES